MFEKKKEALKGLEPEKQKITVEEIIADNKALIDTLQRLQAEFENFKKREEKSREDFSKFCTASVFLDFLDLMDSFESALQKSTPAQKEAVEPLYYQLKKFLEKNGIRQFSAINEIFNPELHEALMTGQDYSKDDNVIIGEIKKGYYLHDKVLRHALVKINQRPVKKVEEIKDELRQRLDKLALSATDAGKEKAEQKEKDIVSEKSFSEESAQQSDYLKKNPNESNLNSEEKAGESQNAN